MDNQAMLNQQQQENNIQIQQQNAPLQQDQQQQNVPLQQDQQENGLQNKQIKEDEVIHARSNIREALENIPGTRDSTDMANVKSALKELGTLLEYRYDLTNARQADAMFSTLDSIEAKYLDAIDKCDHYIKVKDKTFTYFNKQRYKAVKNTQAMLEKEIGYIQQLKDAKEYYKSDAFCKPGLNKSFVDLIDDLRRNENLASGLELGDFIRMTKDNDEDTILCRNGRLYRKNDSRTGSDDTDTPTRENYQMAQRLIELLLAKQNVALGDTRERLTRNLLYQLGADVEQQKAAPIEASRIRELMQNTSTKSTEIELALADKNASLEKDIASQIDKLLGRSLTKNADRKALKKQLKALSARKLNDKAMEQLLGGGTETVRERAYGAAMRIYERRKFLAAQNEEIAPISTEELQSLLSIALSETIATSEVARAVHSSRLQMMEEEMMLDGQTQFGEVNLGEALKNSRIEELACLSGRQIRDYIVKTDKFRRLDVAVRRDGMDAAAAIVDNMREILRLQSIGLRKDLTQEEAAILQSKAAEVDNLYEQHKQALNQINSLIAQDSALAVGLGRLYSLHKENKTLSQYAAVLSGHFTNADKNAPLNRHGNDENGQPVQSQEAISEYSAARAIIDTLDAPQRDIARIFLRDVEPSQLIMRAGNTCSQNLISLHDMLRNLGADDTQEVVVNKVHLTFTQQDNKFLTLHIGGRKVVLPHNAAYWADAMESDICTNFDRYNQESGKAVLKGMLDRYELGSIENRANIERFFTNYLKINAEDMNNLSDIELRELAANYCSSLWTLEEIKQGITNRNNIEIVHVNSKTALESLAAMEQMSEQKRKNIFAGKKYEVNFGDTEEPWDKGLQLVLNFLSDLFFSTKESEGNKDFVYNAERMKKTILNNKEGFLNLRLLPDASRKELLDKMAKLPGFKTATDAIDNLITEINKREQKEIEVMNAEDVADNFKNIFNVFSGGQLKEVRKEKKIVFKSPEEIEKDLQDGVLDEVLNTTAPKLQEAVNSVSDAMQQILTDSVAGLEEETDDDWKTLEDFKVSELLANSLTGKEGEGAFNIKVLKGYIKEANQADKQNMVATAFRYMPNFTKLTNMDDAAAKFMSGYIKGAGPLMHKMLQGLPISSMPPMMQTAIKDVRSNLATIDEDIVDAQLHRIISESDGAIERIEKVRVLGAASVGETILVRVYAPGEKVGEEKVVKLLRPDVQNHMNRELEFMKKCAREVDQEAYRRLHKDDADENNREPAADYEGGMYKTYMNKINNIKKELDLRIEADNVDLGKIYEDELLHIHSMSLDKKSKKMTGAIMLEKAPGMSVDKFLSAMDTERKKIYKMHSAGVSNHDVLLELDKFRDELMAKQKFLLNMSCKWLEEALYKSGFFHGDLHAGNVMIDDNGVTIIDYGNAHKLEKTESSGIINLIVAMTRYNYDRVTSQVEALLKGESAAIFAGKKEELALKIKTIVQKEDDADPVDKILVVFNELQKDGIEIPGGIYNFVQSFVRVFGTLTDYDALIDKVDKNMLSLMEQPKDESREKNPESELAPKINMNILSRHEKAYKRNNDGTSLKKCVDNAASAVRVNTDAIKEFGRVISMNSFDELRKTDGMKPLTDVLDEQYDLINVTQGQFKCRQLMYKVRYDRSMKGNRLKLQMKAIATQLSKIAELSLPGKMEDYTKKITTKRQWLADNPAMIQELEEAIHTLQNDPQLQTSEEKKEELSKKLREKKDLEKELNKANRTLDSDMRINQLCGKYIPIYEEKMKVLQEHIEAPDYSRETALQDLDEVLELGKNLIKEYNLNEEDKAFAAALYDTLKYIKPYNKHDEEDEEEEADDQLEDIEELVDSRVNIDLNKADAAEQERIEAQYDKELSRTSQIIFQRGFPKPYKQKLSEDIVNPEKFHTLGESLTKWYEGANGEQLKNAYDAVAAAMQETEQQLAADAPQVTKLVSEILNCITARAEETDNIFRKKNEKSSSDNINSMMKKLIGSHIISNLGSLSYLGLPYIFRHRATESEKATASQRKKDNHTRFIEPLYTSLTETGFKGKTATLIKAFQSYTMAITENDQPNLKTLKDACNNAINELMQAYSKLNLRAPGKKLLASLVDEYFQAPSARSFVHLTMKMQQYLTEQFKDTAYSDAGKDDDGNELPSQFDNAYDEKLGKEPLSEMAAQTLQFKADATEHLKEDGKKMTPIERLKAGDKMEWVS